MNIAQTLAAMTRVSDAMNAADLIYVDVDQDWNTGSTAWTFDDGSVLVVCGNEARAIDVHNEK